MLRLPYLSRATAVPSQIKKGGAEKRHVYGLRKPVNASGLFPGRRSGGKIPRTFFARRS